MLSPNLGPVIDFSNLFDAGIRTDIAEALAREWESLRRPGSWYASAEKVAIAARARAVRAGLDFDGPASLTEEVADKIAANPGSVRRSWVERILDDGLPVEAYVEAAAVVSRIAAVDGFHRLLGLPLPALPAPGDGEPTGDSNPAAKPSKAFVPMTRGTSIWWSLTLIPEAFERMEDLHNILYLSPEQMQSPGSPRSLSRPQLELVAARTSALNDCFY